MCVGNSLPHRTTLHPAERADNIREAVCLPDSDDEVIYAALRIPFHTQEPSSRRQSTPPNIHHRPHPPSALCDISQACISLIGVHLTGIHLAGVHLTGVHLSNICYFNPNFSDGAYPQ
jgi:hypothetical protein